MSNHHRINKAAELQFKQMKEREKERLRRWEIDMIENNPVVLNMGGIGEGNEAMSNHHRINKAVELRFKQMKEREKEWFSHRGSNKIENNPVVLNMGGIGAGNEAMSNHHRVNQAVSLRFKQMKEHEKEWFSRMESDMIENNPVVLNKSGIGAENQAVSNHRHINKAAELQFKQMKEREKEWFRRRESNLVGNNPVVLKKGGIGAGNEADRDNNLQLVHNDIQEMTQKQETIGSGNYAGENNIIQSGSNNNVYVFNYNVYFPSAPDTNASSCASVNHRNLY